MRSISPVMGIWLEFAAWMAIAAFFYGFSFEFADTMGAFQWGAAAWPRGVVLILVVTAVVHLLIRMHALKRAQAITDPQALEERAGIDPAAALRAAGMIAIPLLYVVLLPHIGFYIGTPLFLIAYLAYLGERRPVRLIGVPVFIYLLVNLVFTKLFFVALPVGNWPGFYDISNWLLVLIR